MGFLVLVPLTNSNSRSNRKRGGPAGHKLVPMVSTPDLRPGMTQPWLTASALLVATRGPRNERSTQGIPRNVLGGRDLQNPYKHCFNAPVSSYIILYRMKNDKLRICGYNQNVKQEPTDEHPEHPPKWGGSKNSHPLQQA